jgi:hypothetical protein
MKFPITRGTLQRFDPIEQKKIRDYIYLQKHIDTIVQEICSDIQFRMEWTMPSRLIPTLWHLDKKKHDNIMNEKRYIWNKLGSIRQIMGTEFCIDENEDILIKLLIEKLKQTFLGCDISIDPMNCVIIDWS